MSHQEPEALAAIERVARELGAPLSREGRDFSLTVRPDGRLVYEGRGGPLEGLTLGLRGEHQRGNAAVALASLELLSARGLVVPAEARRAGLAQARASEESIHALSSIVKDNMSAVRQISTAVSQQNAGFEEIFNAMTDLSQMMTDTMTSLQATQQVASELGEVAQQMQKVARSYRV